MFNAAKWAGPLWVGPSCHRCWESGSADSQRTNKPRRGWSGWSEILTIDTPFMRRAMHMQSRCFIVQHWFLFFQVLPWKWSPNWVVRQGFLVLCPPQRYHETNLFISYLAFLLQSGDRPKLVLWFREEDPAKPIYTVDLRGFNFDNV